MPDFVSLTCPSCGGKLQITDDIDRFACGHCGNEHVVSRGGGIIALSPVVDGLTQVRAGVDRTASELAIVRLEKEIAELEEAIEELNEHILLRGPAEGLRHNLVVGNLRSGLRESYLVYDSPP